MFNLNNKDATPLYRQLFLQIRDQIISGELPAHFKLPSIRAMAVELATSRNTVEGAFQELCAEGYIYSKSRSGYFVSYIDQELASSSRVIHPQQDLHPKLAERYKYDFHPARLDPEVFPASLWRRCLIDCLRSDAGDFSQYSEPQGEWGLRCNLQFYLERSRGVHCTPDQIVVCSGLQQSLTIVAQLARGRHESVAIENPGYHLPREVFHNNGFNITPIDVGIGGLNLSTLKSTSSTVVYITPSHQMPLGYVMPVANRLELISWSKTGERLIIEDDYDSELRYIGRPISSLQGLCSDGNIIYQGTFSKVFSPALRLSYMVLPKSLLNDYHRLFQGHFCQVPLLIQRAMINFMERGHWEQHIRRSRNFYKKKHEIMLQSIGEYFGRKAKVIGQGAGLHIILELAESLNDELAFVERAKQKGLRLLPFSEFYVSSQTEGNKLMLGFGGMKINDIPEGIETLATLIH
ncbi:GntR family transcriptional regulator [Syntrophotalea acetylenivorans]|uniref:GntR family transcriptional regulator n=1 Tax=Syntrophotalea acetylenivorans TaxID=1842532 RepID=A0A1L3GKV4_9BACT|nr:PLP-dependent aminotransferase family protein [Syntrophotalea acetylenivorans]APG26566.1 GntR family transcriptional regulator [Syntrophotalea acetylenivorans]